MRLFNLKKDDFRKLFSYLASLYEENNSYFLETSDIKLYKNDYHKNFDHLIAFAKKLKLVEFKNNIYLPTDYKVIFKFNRNIFPISYTTSNNFIRTIFTNKSLRIYKNEYIITIVVNKQEYYVFYNIGKLYNLIKTKYNFIGTDEENNYFS